jgi:hypothetical protein
MYWKSSSPIAVIDASAKYYSDGGGSLSCINIFIRNTGAYAITLSRIQGGNTSITRYIDYVTGETHNLNELRLAPGEEMCFSGTCGSCRNHGVWISTPTSYVSHQAVLAGATTICNNGSTGQLLVKNFGFEYIAYVEGQPVTKRQIGSKDFIVKCG